MILAELGLHAFAQLHLYAAQRIDDLLLEELRGHEVVLHEALIGLTQRLDRLVEAAHEVAVASEAAAQLLGVAQSLADVGSGLAIGRTSYRAAAGRGLGVLGVGG